MSNDASPLEAVSKSTPTRRTLLRTGAHAAWMIPAVQIVSQVPAFAASGDGLAIDAATWSGGAANGFKRKAHTPFSAHVEIKNNDVDPATALQAVITLKTTGGIKFGSSVGAGGVSASNPPGWSLTDIDGQGSTTLHFYYLATGNLAAGASVNFDPTWTINYPPVNSRITASVLVVSGNYPAIGSPLTYV